MRNLIFLFLTLQIFLSNSLKAESTVSLSPIILPNYSDITLSGEYMFHPSNTVTGFFTKNKKSCPECSTEGSANAISLGALYRFYFNNASSTSWFFELGLSRLTGEATNDETNKTVKKTVWEKILTFGNRIYFYGSLFAEYKFGLVDRSQGISANGYNGYRKTTPLIGFSLGMKF